MSKFGVCSISLGYTRLAGLLVYDTKTREFEETKPKAAREMIDKGLIYGVVWDKKDQLFKPDEKFNRKDMLVKSGVGNYRKLLKEVTGEKAGSDYILVRVLKTNKGNLYEVVNNRCQRVKLTETQIKGLYAIGTIGGMIVNKDETITICDGVVIENRVYPDEVVLDLTPMVDSTEDAAEESPDAGKLSGEVPETEVNAPGSEEGTEKIEDDDFMKVPDSSGNDEGGKEQTLKDIFKDAGGLSSTEETSTSDAGKQKKDNKTRAKRRK